MDVPFVHFGLSSFTTVNGSSRTNLARLNDDGSLDPSFDPGTGVFSAHVALQPDGKVLVGGGRIARLNSDGSLDTSFNPGTAAVGGLIALQPDGKIITLGFTTVNDVNRIHIARLNTNGTLDTSFNPSNAADDSTTCMALQPDGRLLIGGWFASINGVARNYVARLFWGDPAVLVSGPTKVNGDFVAGFRGTPGLTYTIESSASVSSTSWQKVTNRTAPTTDQGLGVGVFELRDPMQPSGRRFYRAVFPAY